MKILSGNLKDKDINFNCRCCNANFDLESKDDFHINWIYKPINRHGTCDYNIKIPEYNIKCPVCGYVTYIGTDPIDCGEDFNDAIVRGAYANIIFNRKDWKERYKIAIKITKLDVDKMCIMSYKKRVIDVEEWNEWYKKLTNNLEPYDHYDMGYGDAVDRIDDWMDTQLIIDVDTGLLGQYRWERDVAIEQLEELGLSLGQEIDGVYLTKEEYKELLEYKYMYEDLCG